MIGSCLLIFLIFCRRVDVIKEFSRIRQSVSMLETHFLTGSRHSTDKLSSAISQDQSTPAAKLNGTGNDPAPGMLGMQGHGGTYSGATSAASHLVTVRACSVEKSIALKMLVFLGRRTFSFSI
jgi:hypothetical protein